MQSIAKMQRLNTQLGLQFGKQLRELQSTTVGSLKRLQAMDDERTLGKVAQSIVESKHANSAAFQNVSQSMRDLSSHMISLETHGHDIDRYQSLLQSLYFDAFHIREDAIEDAHAKTFDWVVQPAHKCTHQGARPSRFTSWLREGSGIFWVQGKAGSGKSTLMKFICRNSDTREHLRSWAGDKKLVVANYFFWNSGTTLEKSQEGLLRAVLFEMLRAYPELLPAVEQACRGGLANRGGGMMNTHRTWTRPELLQVFSSLDVSHFSSGPWAFCFFIDGLDEYKGDTFDLIATIQHLASFSSIKICASSRPWTQFVDAFGDKKKSLMKLEDLTRRDIHNYVFDRLLSNKRFCELQDLDGAGERLAAQVVKRAQGVFLWVVLVVRSLLEGATYADTLEDMQQRLDAFPKDLESYFSKILDDIPKVYRKRTASMLQLAMTGDGPLPLSTYYFFDKFASDPLFALKSTHERTLIREYQNIRMTMTRRLDGRCKGLLEVVRCAPGAADSENPLRANRVDFMHRTVKDFLLSSDLQAMTPEEEPGSPDPNVALAHAFLAEMKQTNSNLTKPAEDFALYAGRVDETWIEKWRVDLAVFDAEDVYNTWAKSKRVGGDFLSVAIKFGLGFYLDQGIADASKSASQLLDETISLLDDPETVQLGSLPRVVQSLLGQGANPNATVEPPHDTVWTKFVHERLPVTTRSGLDVGQVHEILMLLAGTAVDLSVPVSMQPRQKMSVGDYMLKHAARGTSRRC